MATVRKLIKHPVTGKRLHQVFITGKGWYRWNSVYRVYNHSENYDQLQEQELAAVDFEKDEKTA